MTDEINTNIALETPTEQVVEAQPTSIENVVTETPTVESTATDTDLLTPDEGVKEETTEDNKEAVVEETPATEEKPAEPEVAPEPIVIDDVVVPDGFVIDETSMGEFKGLLSELSVKSKVDKEVLQDFGQKLFDRYTDELRKINENNVKAWEKIKADDKAAFENDPEIGGVHKDATIAAAKECIRTHGGTFEQQKDLYSIFQQRGLANNPTVIRFLANMAKNTAEGQPISGTKPLPDTKKDFLNQMYAS